MSSNLGSLRCLVVGLGFLGLGIVALPADKPPVNVPSSNIGITSAAVRFTNFGRYLYDMAQTVQRRRDDLVTKTKPAFPHGTVVTVRFILDSSGRISRIVGVTGRPEAAGRLAANALLASSPFAPWTDEMKAMLGEEQSLAFSFYFE